MSTRMMTCTDCHAATQAPAEFNGLPDEFLESISKDWRCPPVAVTIPGIVTSIARPCHLSKEFFLVHSAQAYSCLRS